MEQWISHEPNRRDCWKGHPSKKGVRLAIARARAHGRSLRLFTYLATDPGVFIEIPADDWDDRFKEA